MSRIALRLASFAIHWTGQSEAKGKDGDDQTVAVLSRA